MGNIRTQPSGKLYFDFRYLGKRCREITTLEDTQLNRKKLEAILKRIEAEIVTGQFDYAKYFPSSSFLKQVRLQEKRLSRGALRDEIPLLAQIIRAWLDEHEIEWRESYKTTITSMIERHIVPALGDMPVDAITREVLVQFRSGLAKYRSSGGLALSPSSINRIMTILRSIIEHACHEYKLSSPWERIKKLKVEKTHVDPFTLDEVRRMVDDVRSDFRDYLFVRFFTGMRTGEIHGLRWKCVDFERREILVRETFTMGNFEYTKNDHSQREISMSQPVYEALKRQFEVTGMRGRDGLVFCTRNGSPIDAKNFTSRIWKPMLEDLGIEYRRPYNTRHTTATLWLASGEAPEWVARQMGHANTTMLFQVYSRFVPNLTRNDGSAMERLLAKTVSAPSEVLS